MTKEQLFSFDVVKTESYSPIKVIVTLEPPSKPTSQVVQQSAGSKNYFKSNSKTHYLFFYLEIKKK